MTEKRTVGKANVVLEARRHKNVDLGCETKSHGYEVTLDLDERGEVEIGGRGRMAERLDDEALEDLLEEAEVNIAKTGQHVATKLDDEWRIHHMLAEGPMFPSGRTEWEDSSDPDLDALPTSIEIAIENLGDDAHWRHPGMWAAIEQSPSVEALDIAVLQRWPATSLQGEGLSHARVRKLAKPGSAASDAWRKAFRLAASSAMTRGDDAAKEATEVMILADGGVSEALRGYWLAAWPRSDAVNELLIQHAADGSPSFKQQLSDKAEEELGKMSACRASIMLAFLAPERQSCEQVNKTCAGRDDTRIEDSCPSN